MFSMTSTCRCPRILRRILSFTIYPAGIEKARLL
jgi:hypothetical protein